MSAPEACRSRLCVPVLLLLGVLPGRAAAETPVFDLEIRNHLFYPSSISIPAGTKIRLLVHNRDDTSEEFESYEMNREKVILGGSSTVIFIGPLRPGEYPFFGEFHPNTAQGRIIVE